jgi:hypothetical protein
MSITYLVGEGGILNVQRSEIPIDPRKKTPVATFGPGQWVCAETTGVSAITSADSGS